MRKIVAALFVSVDGVVEAPNEFTTGYMQEEVGQELEAQMAARDTMLLGRRTYQEFNSELIALGQRARERWREGLRRRLPRLAPARVTAGSRARLQAQCSPRAPETLDFRGF
jgi:hypothetical protein